MNKITDKLLLLILCIAASSALPDIISVITVLIVLIFSCLLQVTENSRSGTFLTWIFGGICLAFPQLCCGCGMIIYDICGSRKFFRAVPIALSLAINAGAFSALQWGTILFSLLFALVSRHRADRLSQAEIKLIQLRDSSVETEILLTEKNKQIIEHQDSEIYMAALKERNRIAREIHDNVGHLLTRSILQVGALTVISADATQKEALSSLSDTLNTAMTNIRQSVHDLHNESVDLKLSLTDCLKCIEGRFTVTTDLDISETLPRTVKLCIIGVVKEAVSNIVKHSNGSCVWVSVREHPAFYQAVVKDNGCCAETVGESGIGLINMRERAAAVGGIATFSAGKSGFKVFLSIPKEAVRVDQNSCG